MLQPRREFLKSMGLAAAGLGLAALPGELLAEPTGKLFFDFSLAEWSLHRALFGGKMTNLDFPAKAKNDFQISAVEYVNQFFKDKATDQRYLTELKQRAADVGVRNVLIMIDGEGYLADLDKAKRSQAVENHHKWVDAAKFLGCHSIRVNAHGEGTEQDVAQAAIDGLGRLTEYGAKNKIGVIVENHGGYSSNGQWLSSVIKQVNNPYCGVLPDFGNFCLSADYGTPQGCSKAYDRYKGVQEMMPYAKGVSAKSYAFDSQGNETIIDYVKMLRIVKKAGYTGHIGVEYEGEGLSEEDGIRATKRLLEKAGAMV
ncbi:sugar phosphate isomerase/epimerase family protein [Hymenobacter jejuensis]|uniref:TIM barrel protein n=1 Tax=Hymenobacter jejuensis TaxID=2502781 RepID=A0A5B7ZZF0_9BACT|nr:sugar phosphate isomerase/epimerase family protein [Hymenobacter jejuensis]QDA59833.1 TIM barrel protein [Hymenobacter jejuensis]